MAEAAAIDKDVDIPDTAEGGGASNKKKKLKKLLLFVGLPVLLLGGGGGGAFVAGVFDSMLGVEEHAAEGEGAEGEHAEDGEHVAAVQYYDLPDMLVNLNTSSRTNSFLKIQVALELDAEADVHAVETVLPRIIDSFQVYLRELRPEDLKGSEGLYRLKEELLLRVNQVGSTVPIRDVLFKSVLAQ